MNFVFFSRQKRKFLNKIDMLKYLSQIQYLFLSFGCSMANFQIRQAVVDWF